MVSFLFYLLVFAGCGRYGFDLIFRNAFQPFFFPFNFVFLDWD